LILLTGGTLFTGFSHASDEQGTFELLLGNYDIKDAHFKTIYKEGGRIRGIGLSAFLPYNFNLYFELKEFHRQGELSYSLEKTKFVLVPLSLGIRYVVPLKFFHPYAGAGLDFYFYYEDNPIGTAINYARGSHFLAGTYFQFAESVPVWLNLKLKFTRVAEKLETRTLELGGFEYGMGLVVAF
jgi:hypothetical protein